MDNWWGSYMGPRRAFKNGQILTMFGRHLHWPSVCTQTYKIKFHTSSSPRANTTGAQSQDGMKGVCHRCQKYMRRNWRRKNWWWGGYKEWGSWETETGGTKRKPSRPEDEWTLSRNLTIPCDRRPDPQHLDKNPRRKKQQNLYAQGCPTLLHKEC